MIRRPLRIPVMLTWTALYGAGVGIATSCTAAVRPVTHHTTHDAQADGVAADVQPATLLAEGGDGPDDAATDSPLG
jgi:hypothetical protein